MRLQSSRLDSLYRKRRHVDDKLILYIALQHPLVCLVDVLQVYDLHIGGDPLSSTEVKHLLPLSQAAYQ